ncbi:MAG: site-specific integrase [Nitrospinota bacterium]
MRGDGRVFRRGAKWWISYYAPKDGKSVEHREPGGKTEPEARRLLKARLREIAVHKTGLRPFQGPRQERLTVDDLLQTLERDYEVRGKKSIRQLRSHNRHVRAFFTMDRALAVSMNRLRDYIAHRQGEKAAPATINREIEGLQRAFALAVEAGTLALAPRFPSFSERNARQGFFERGEFEAVLGHLGDEDLRDFLRWFYFTGMRPGEIRALTWADLDRETWTLRLHARDAKTGQGRALALEGEFRTIIERRIRARRIDCPFIFHRGGERMGEFRKAWNAACEKAGVAGRIPYDLRRTAVRNMIRAGVDQAVAMKISGHRTDAIFRRYNIVSDDDLREAVVKTAAYVASLPAERKVLPLAEGTAGKNFP